MIFLRNAHAPSILLSRRCMTVDAKTRRAIQDILAANCELLTIPETAARLRVNKNNVYDLIKKDNFVDVVKAYDFKGMTAP